LKKCNKVAKTIIFIENNDVGLFNRGKDKTEIKALQTQVLSLQQAVQRSFIITASRNIINQNTPIYPSYTLDQQVNRYSNTDDIYSIINRIAKTSALIPIYSYEIQEDKAFRQLQMKSHEPGQMYHYKKLQTKALVDLSETDKLYQLLENPHFTLSKFQFRQAIHTLLPLQGKVYLYKIRQNQFGVNEKGEVIDVNEGPPIKLEIMLRKDIVEVVTNFPKQVLHYKYRPNGIVLIDNIPPEDMIVISNYEGISPVDVLGLRLTQVDSQIDVTVAQMQNGGVPGIVYDKGDDGEEVTTSDGGTALASDLRKDNYYKYSSNKVNKGAPMFSSGELGYIQLGLPLVDLDVVKLSGITFKKLCNAFGISDRLFNNDATGSEISDNNAKIGLYTDACLPNVYLERDAYIAGLVPEFAEDRKRRTIREDISEIPALQGDILKMAQAFAALPCFVPNEVREMFHQEKDIDPAADKLYIKTGYVSIEDLQGSGDLPLTPDYVIP
jgi:phage portal protein BeeE